MARNAPPPNCDMVTFEDLKGTVLQLFKRRHARIVPWWEREDFMPKPRDEAETLLEKARALAPKLRERAAATNQARRIPDETIQDFWNAGLWYLMKPKSSVAPRFGPTSRSPWPRSSPAPTDRPVGFGRCSVSTICWWRCGRSSSKGSTGRRTR